MGEQINENVGNVENFCVLSYSACSQFAVNHPVWSVTLKDNGNEAPSLLSFLWSLHPFGQLVNSLVHFTFIQTHSPKIVCQFYKSIKTQIKQVRRDFAVPVWAWKQMSCSAKWSKVASYKLRAPAHFFRKGFSFVNNSGRNTPAEFNSCEAVGGRTRKNNFCQKIHLSQSTLTTWIWIQKNKNNFHPTLTVEQQNCRLNVLIENWVPLCTLSCMKRHLSLTRRQQMLKRVIAWMCHPVFFTRGWSTHFCLKRGRLNKKWLHEEHARLCWKRPPVYPGSHPGLKSSR